MLDLFHEASLSFNKGLNIAPKINCGIDLIGVSISDGIPGFTVFLELYNSNFGKILSRGEWDTTFTFNFNNFNFEATYNRGHKRLYIRVGALTQYSDTSKAYRRWELLQCLCRHYTSSIKINELHFAVDMPYRYADIQVHPAENVYQPPFLSTKYFDKKRIPNAKLDRDDDFVIYDKCRKCRIGISLTRIELRLKINTLGDTIYDTTIQERIATKVNKKFNELKIKKKRSHLNINTCEWGNVLVDVMKFITIDNSMYKSILKHRDEAIADTATVFKRYMAFCKKNHIYSAKPQNVAKSKEFLNLISPEERVMLNTTIASYNAYDKKWYKDTRFNMKKVQDKKRITPELIEEILFMLQMSQSQVSIAEELNISEATVSRVVRKTQARRMDLKELRVNCIEIGDFRQRKNTYLAKDKLIHLKNSSFESIITSSI